MMLLTCNIGKVSSGNFAEVEFKKGAGSVCSVACVRVVVVGGGTSRPCGWMGAVRTLWKSASVLRVLCVRALDMHCMCCVCFVRFVLFTFCTLCACLRCVLRLCVVCVVLCVCALFRTQMNSIIAAYRRNTPGKKKNPKQ